MTDKIFKIGILILAILFVFTYYRNAPVARYQVVPWNPPGMLDTSSGKIYAFSKDSGKWFIIQPVIEAVPLAELPKVSPEQQQGEQKK
jgi:hypothetical protein